MVRKTMSLRLVKYCTVGLIPFTANFLTFNLFLTLGITVGFATGIGFVVGGQVAFWAHDRLTFGDRHVSLKGWARRWRRFMPGQMAGFTLNWLAANALVEFTNAHAYVIYTLATVAGVVGTFSWTNWFSHKDDSSTSPAEPESTESQD